MNERTNVALIVVVIAAAAAALFGQAAYAAWPPADPLALATAVGTVAAVVVALWLASREDGRRKREAIERAELAAAAVLIRIDMQQTVLRVRMSELELPVFTLSHASVLRDNLQRAGLVPPDLIAALIPLPNKCAARLARAQSLLEWCLTEVTGVARDAPANRSQIEVPGLLVRHWNLILREAHLKLEQVAKDCREAASGQRDLL